MGNIGKHDQRLYTCTCAYFKGDSLCYKHWSLLLITDNNAGKPQGETQSHRENHTGPGQGGAGGVSGSGEVRVSGADHCHREPRDQCRHVPGLCRG